MAVMFFISIVICCVISGCSRPVDEQVHQEPVEQYVLEGKKMLLVDSYHPEYVESMQVFKELDKFARKEKIELKVIYLDEKHRKADDLLRQAADRARNMIETWRPDIVIAADDPVSKYLVSEYYRDAPLPIVFTGVNWNASQYGYPYKNVTGQIEIEFIKELIDELRQYARGFRTGFLTGDTLTDRKVCNYYVNDLKIDFFQKIFVNTFDEWKTGYLALQNTCAVVLARNNSGIEGWNNDEAYAFVMEHTKVPTGSVLPQMAPFVLIDYSKIFSEFGMYAAETAYKILTGTPPSKIPISKNTRLRVYLNMPLAKKLGILFPMRLIEQATFVEYGSGNEDNN